MGHKVGNNAVLTFPKRSKEQCSSTVSVHAKNLQCPQITVAASVFGSSNVFMCLEIMESGNKIKTCLIMKDTADDNGYPHVDNN